MTVSYATADGTRHRPAATTPRRSGTPHLHPRPVTTQTITVPVNGDTLDEADETFSVNLTLPVNATIADGQGQGTITNDDARPALSIDDVDGRPRATAAPIERRRSPSACRAASGQTVTVNYATADGTADGAGRLHAAAGDADLPARDDEPEHVTVPVNGDTLDEANETFFVNLRSPINATIADGQGVGTITDDDPLPTLSIDDVTVTEGNSGTVNATFTRHACRPPSGQTVTVDYATADGTATAPAATTRPRRGTLTFAPGQTTQTVTVPVNGDTLDEANETFSVNLTNAGQRDDRRRQGVGTITNDDPLPSALDQRRRRSPRATAARRTPPSPSRLSTPSGQTVTVDYATADGTATARGDYTGRRAGR